MKQPNFSNRKVSILVIIAIVIVALYGLDRLILFIKSPYIGTYGEFRSEGYSIQTIIDVKSSESLSAGMTITSIEDKPIEHWVQSLFVAKGPGPSGLRVRSCNIIF